MEIVIVGLNLPLYFSAASIRQRRIMMSVIESP
jgi:hypothetical protein